MQNIKPITQIYRQKAKKAFSIILASAIAASAAVLPVFAEDQISDDGINYIINHNYSDPAYDTTEEVFATGRYYVGGIGEGKDTTASEDNNISAVVEDGKLVLTAKSAAENTFDFDLRKDGQPLIGKVYIEYKVEIMDNTTEVRLEPRNSGSTLYSMAFGPNAGGNDALGRNRTVCSYAARESLNRMGGLGSVLLFLIRM